MVPKCALPALLVLLPLQAADKPDGIEFFERKIRPVLATQCYSCHSAAAKPVQGGLMVASRDGLRRGGASRRPAVVEKRPDDSVLLTSLRHSGPVRMPPGQKLPDEVIADFEEWIKMGAPDPRDQKLPPAPPPYDFEKARTHWAFQPVRDPQPPAVPDPLWSKTAIDRFVKAKLDERKLTPLGLAAKRTLIRRATFDLTGLPPTPEDVDAFVKDTTPSAFEKLIDRLLASPQYGEKWGRHWLDVVRYADTAGCNSDFPVPDAYRYRNWVIQAFNSDKPYMDFLREQIAGDMLEAKNDEDRNAKLVATGYIAISRRFASNKNEHHLTIDDTIDNIGKSMLGLSVACARCHDHKFEAIPQRDYWGLYSILDSTVYAFPGVETFPRPHDFVALGGPENEKKLSEWENKIKETHTQIRELRFGNLRHAPDARERIQSLNNSVLALEMRPPEVPKAYAVRDGEGHSARIHYKGDPRIAGEEAPRRWLTLLGGHEIPADEKSSGRRQLAEWITDRGNPLTPRVIVNRIWQWHFGKGLVPTPNDFGVRGEAPTHPELLDWLTSRFVESGYSIRKMHKLMMLTRAYQLASGHHTANANVDPKNSYLWRFDRRRLEAEEIRDSMLAVSGRLDPLPGAGHPFPPVHQWRFSQHRQFFASYEHDKRTVYLMHQRLRKHPLLELFDPADPNASTPGRAANVTALQALALMNNEWVHTQADALAVRVGMAYSDAAARIQYAYKLAVGRPATQAEVLDGAAYVEKARLALSGSGLPAERMPRAALASYMRVLLSSDEFFFVD